MQINSENLLVEAKEVLNKNWVTCPGKQCGFTKPSTSLYPFQWNWDSGFIAYGYCHYDVEKAIEELRSLFQGQWSNGMLPHIVFHGESDGYFPGPDYWDAASVNTHAPRQVHTSGITQPPIHAMSIWHIYSHIDDEKIKQELLEEFYPKLYNLHEYLHSKRDPEGWGLVTIYHPWESGFDNSPRWDKPLARIGVDNTYNITRLRQDTKEGIDPAARPSNRHYDAFLSLMDMLKERGYNDHEIYNRHPFKVKDIVFSSILYLANGRLKQMAEALGQQTGEIEEWLKRFEDSCSSRIWSEFDKLYYDYDVNAKELIPAQTIAGLLPLATGILPEEKLQAMVRHFDELKIKQGEEDVIGLAPSVGVENRLFNPDGYWRGPIWININWFLWRAFLKYNLAERADTIKQDILEIVSKEGFYEYYNPLTGKGIGAKDFSWTAALVLDLLADHNKA